MRHIPLLHTFGEHPLALPILLLGLFKIGSEFFGLFKIDLDFWNCLRRKKLPYNRIKTINITSYLWKWSHSPWKVKLKLTKDKDSAALFLGFMKSMPLENVNSSIRKSHICYIYSDCMSVCWSVDLCLFFIRQVIKFGWSMRVHAQNISSVTIFIWLVQKHIPNYCVVFYCKY